MPAALTGSLGWAGGRPIQLGGPPLVNSYGRPLPDHAVRLVAHAYQNDGVTFISSFSVLNWTPIKATTANGGFDQVTLELAMPVALTQGNVVRLSEASGPFKGFIFSGTVEDLPDTIGLTTVTHGVLLTHFGFELNDVHSTSVYTTPTDLGQIVRDAVAQTFHCSCDQVSVPAFTGILAPSAAGSALDFRQQTVQQQIDTCRAIAGATWFWYVDEMGRVWFQYMGTSAVYTLMRGPHYSDRVTSNSIANRKNQVVVVGGVPTGGSANAQAVYNGTSQAVIGIRSLFPSLSLPNITDQPTLQFIANNVGAVLDRVWRQVTLTVQAPFTQRIHGSQPGGPMIRYWEPAINPIPESESATGTYIGPYIVNSVQWDELHQVVVAGDLPIVSQSDLQNMINNLVNSAASVSLFVTGAALNLQQTFTGVFQSGTGTNTKWQLDSQEFKAIDPNGTTRAEMGDLLPSGISPAQWGFRALDANGSPIFDSLGLIAVMAVLASNFGATTFSTSSTTPVLITGSGVTVSPARQSRVLVLYTGVVAYSGQTAFIDLFVDGVIQSTGGNGPAIELQYPTTSSGAVTSTGFFTAILSAASHTIDLRASQNGVGTMTVQQNALLILQLGVT